MDDSDKDITKAIAAKKDSTSLNWAGASYIAGDIALWMAGEFGGAWWLAGGIGAAVFGHPKAEKQYQLLSDRLGNYLRRHNVPIPENPDMESLRRKGGVLDHIESFMYTYPSQILNTAYTIGSLLLIKSGLFPKAGDPKSYSRAGAGALVIAGALGGLLIKEKKQDPQHPPKGFVPKTWAWFQEKPLRWPAVAYYLNDVLLAKDALNDTLNHSRRSKSYFKWLTVAAYAFGNYMLMKSNKNHAGTNASKEALEKVVQTATYVVAAQPKEIQEKLVKELSEHLASQKESHLKAGEIAELLHKNLAEVGKPRPEGWRGRLDTSSPSLTPSH